MSDAADIKAALRTAMQARRAEAHAAADPGPALARLLDAIGADGPVSAYWPMRSELDLRPALDALHARGTVLAMPVVLARATPLAFRRWAPGDRLVPAGFGTRVPEHGAPVEPAVLVVPLLAFDRRGWRLGYGGGFYDRTLAALRARGPVRAIGLAYAAQEVPEVPTTVDDQPLDLIVTERETIGTDRNA